MTDNNKEYHEAANKLLRDITQLHQQIESISSTVPAPDRIPGAVNMLTRMKMVLSPTMKTMSELESFVLSRK